MKKLILSNKGYTGKVRFEWSMVVDGCFESSIKNTVTTQTDDDWHAVGGEDNGIACWKPNSCSPYPWQSPGSCHSTFAH